MKKLRIGVIGLGVGAWHINGYREHPAAEVVAISDLDLQRLRRVGDEKGITGLYESPEEMLRTEQLDIVSVATPNKFHAPLTIAALEAGVHVLCEKPMAMTALEARDMLAAAERCGRRLMINFSYRFSEQSVALKQVVDSGTLGDVYFARSIWHRRRGMPGFGGWFGTKALSGGGPLIDLGVHRLDLALWLMGYPKPTWVMGSTYDAIARGKAIAENRSFDVEDLAVALIRFDNGATLEIEASWAANIKERELMETRLMGTRGGLLQRNRNEGYEFDAEIFVERDGCQFDMALHPPVPTARCSQYHFVDSVLNDTPHIATGEEGVIVMELLDAIYQSAREGAPVRVQALEPSPEGAAIRAA